MDPVTLSALISGGSKLAGGLLDAFGGGSNNHAGRDRRQALAEAVHASIGGKVEEAKKYGISPLYALGAPIMSSSFQSAGGDDGLRGMGRTLSDMGQDVSRAVAATQSPVERKIQALTLDKAALENDFLREQIASLRMRTRNEVGPGLPEKVQDPQRTTGVNVGLKHPWESDPTVSDLGQYIEDRYGDDNPLTWPIGAYGMLRDAWYNIKKDFGRRGVWPGVLGY